MHLCIMVKVSWAENKNVYLWFSAKNVFREKQTQPLLGKLIVNKKKSEKIAESTYRKTIDDEVIKVAIEEIIKEECKEDREI